VVVVGVEVAITHFGMISNPHCETSGSCNPSLHSFMCRITDVFQEEVLVGIEQGGRGIWLEWMVPERRNVSEHNVSQV